MAAGQGFKTFTTGEVLTAADVNGYLMQGVGVFTDAANRDAEITSPQEGQFAYLKDTNVTTYYTGSAWANLDTTGMTNPMTTTGDTIYSSSGSTPARLGIGTSGQVLTVSGGLPAWATSASGAFTLLSTTALTGASTTISGISGSYTDLYIVAYGMQNATANGQLRIAPNASTTITDAAFTSNSTNDFNFNSYLYPYPVGGAELRTGTNHICVMTMSQYSSTAMYKNYTGTMSYVDGASAQRIARFGGSIKTTSAITSLVFSNTGGNWSAGTVLVYGVK